MLDFILSDEHSVFTGRQPAFGYKIDAEGNINCISSFTVDKLSLRKPLSAIIGFLISKEK